MSFCPALLLIEKLRPIIRVLHEVDTVDPYKHHKNRHDILLSKKKAV